MSVNLGSAYGAIMIDASGAMASITATRVGLLGLVGPMGMAGGAAVAMGAAVAAAAVPIGALGFAIGSSVQTAATFEQAMSRVGALSGATGADFDALTAKAEELGATTAFTATEAAQGMQYLAMAGYDTNDILAAMPGLLATAAAGQLDLATTSDIVSNILSGFGIDAANTGDVADVLTKTFTSANVDMRMLGESMKYVAPVASTLGIGLEETAAAVGLLGNAGIQGTMAGTALRTSITRLAAPTGEAADLIQQLGIATQDSEGNLLSLPELLNNVNAATSGMTAVQRTAAIETLVGKNAMSAFMVLLDSAASNELPNFITELENAGGTAETVAARQLDNLLGAKTLLDSAIDGIKTSIGNEFLPMLTEGVRGMTDFLTQNRGPIINFFGGIAGWLRHLGDQAGPIISSLYDRFITLVGAFQTGGGGGLLAALGVSPEVLTYINLAINDISALGQGIADFASGALAAYDQGGLNGLIQFITDEIDTAGPTIASHADAWSQLIWGWVNQAIDAGAAKLNELAASLSAWVNSPDAQTNLNNLGQSIADMILSALGLQMSNQERAGGALANLAGALVQSIPSIIGSLIMAGGQVVAGIMAGIANSITGGEYQAQTIEQFRQMAQWMIDTIITIDWLTVGSNIIDGIIEGIQSKAEELQAKMSEVVTSLPETAANLLGIKSPSTVFAGIGRNISLGLADGIRAAGGIPADEIAAVSGALPDYARVSGPQTVDNSRTTTNQFSMNIGTVQNGEAAVVQGYHTLRALAA